MDWTHHVDGYCERLDASFWAEPINAITNAAFLIVAILIWPRMKGLVMAKTLAANLFVIGIGSFLFHTFAQTWAGVADVLPIVSFVLLYIFAATREFWGQSTLRSGLAVLLFFPYAAALIPLFSQVPLLGASAAYIPVALLIAIYAFGLRHRHPKTAKNLGVGAALILVSITLRSLDEPLCHEIAIGTHYWWHLLNAVALGWMIETYRRHMLAPPAKQG